MQQVLDVMSCTAAVKSTQLRDTFAALTDLEC